MNEKPLIGITPDYSYEKRRFKISEDYTFAVIQAGGIPILLVPGEAFPDFIDGLIFSGGGDINPLLFGEEPIWENGEISPLRDEYELALCKEALKTDIPILGICRGMQIMNIAAGGGIYQDIAAQTGTTLKHSQQAPRPCGTHSITPTEGSLLARLWQKEKIIVNSVHHQAVSFLGAGMTAAAQSPDGLTEAIEAADKPFVLGVQWHPEAMRTKEQEALFAHFVQAAMCYRERRRMP
ncbi:gamma-glutamyl-gamma-aminobutyrate hydrolase family protein [Anaerotignum lactatifermentans]|uniref:Gamma-glutamyl-gamma-aminobutyrate hydrolase family protein n=1 Tax=Anaerotignum lactatifermentans TaxID=160404 RepID=A0ABS2GAR0_9FIRM|nr:gamma-glutamyl-gamma-aminobutyrate hydrolase family protein [Anaerotignum lactatifermentans]MBM6828607.1 gamma-glutamyl-gamma-aminobutyrate hydrolase family protein [Anaerotignum lactatifermentans]MBM6878521.1 gamma-glutamyl-gamma-aminobutyrate hydrolase family protein [Anaerotignum lactatifermentans]MBM6950189.1 gamma-glutamyl-gamma-aminobutyrate hydrolase family protein [Anaerotignum lactatifermentans]